jgi:hypothetical protein
MSQKKKNKKLYTSFHVLKIEMFFNLMINMRINFNFITMMLIKHISNMYSSTVLKNKCTFSLLFKLSKLVQIGEIR